DRSARPVLARVVHRDAGAAMSLCHTRAMARFTLVLTALALVACGSRDDDVLEDAGTGDSMVGSDMGAPDLDVDTGTGTDSGAPDLGPMDAGPDCTGLPVCTTEGVSCDGNTRVVCGHNPAGCLIESRID